MRTGFMLAAALCLLGPGAAMASFTYVPAAAPEAPVIREAAQEAAQRAPIVPAADLSLPGPSTAERKKAEKELEKAREALRKKEAAAAKRWEEMERRAGRPAIPADAPKPLPPSVDVTEVVVRDGGASKAVNIAPVTPPPAPVDEALRTARSMNPAVGIEPIPAAQAMPAVEAFTVGRGSLKDQLTKYAERNGYQVSWNYPDDLVVTNSTTFATGSFAGNLRKLFETLQYIGRRDIQATLFQGNNTIVVEPSRR